MWYLYSGSNPADCESKLNPNLFCGSQEEEMFNCGLIFTCRKSLEYRGNSLTKNNLLIIKKKDPKEGGGQQPEPLPKIKVQNKQTSLRTI